MYYAIRHLYETIGDDGDPVQEAEDAIAEDAAAVADIVRRMIDHPGGRSGTTVAIWVGLTEPQDASVFGAVDWPPVPPQEPTK